MKVVEDAHGPLRIYLPSSLWKDQDLSDSKTSSRDWRNEDKVLGDSKEDDDESIVWYRGGVKIMKNDKGKALVMFSNLDGSTC